MVEPVLVTSGNDLKIWETSSYTQIYSYSPENRGIPVSILSNSWSTDTAGIASILKDEDKILLTYYKNQKYNTHEIKTDGVSRPSYLQWPRTSQKHLFLSALNAIHYYDMERHKSRKSFLLKSNISCFIPNQTDSYLAIGCDNGSLVLLTTASNQLSQPFTAPKCDGQRINCVRYSPRRSGFLGAACESGTISFWDFNASKNIFNINEHLAPCTGLAFTPVNDKLAASCGLDKKLICHDTKSKKTLFNVVIEQPCTSVDFDNDGVNIAVGTSRGKVFIYDLRNVTQPVSSMQAHNGKVSSLSFKPRVDKVNMSQVMSAVKSTSKSKLRSQKSISSLRTVVEESKENLKPDIVQQLGNPPSLFQESSPVFSDSSPYSRRDSMSSQLFSPLKEVDVFDENTPNPTSKNSSRRGSEARLSTEGLFSPLREENTSLGGRRTSYMTTPFMSPLTSIQEEAVSCTPAPQPVLSSSAFESLSAGSCSEKLSLEKLPFLVREVTCTSEGSPEFHTVPCSSLDSAVEWSGVLDMYQTEDETRQDHLVRPLGSSLCGIRDEDRNKPTAPGDTHIVKTTAATAEQLASDDVEQGRAGRADGELLAGALLEREMLEREMKSVLIAFPTAFLEGTRSNQYPRSLNNNGPPSSKSYSTASATFHSSTAAFDATACFPHPAAKPSGFSAPNSGLGRSQNCASIGSGVTEGFSRRYMEEWMREVMEDRFSGLESMIVNLHYSNIRLMQEHQDEVRMYIEEIHGLEALRVENRRLQQENEELRRFF